MKEKLKVLLKEDTELALVVSKINDRIIFKEKEGLQVRSKIKLTKKDNMRVYAETIKK